MSILKYFQKDVILMDTTDDNDKCKYVIRHAGRQSLLQPLYHTDLGSKLNASCSRKSFQPTSTPEQPDNNACDDSFDFSPSKWNLVVIMTM